MPTEARPAVVFSPHASRITVHASRLTPHAILLALLLAPALVHAAEPFVPGKDGWVSLFDGSEQGRWKAEKGADWTLKDGVLVGTRGEMLDTWHWVDFELVAQVRGTGALRCRLSQILMAEQAGYWLDLADGTLRRDGPGGPVVAKGSGARSGEWRELRLVASEGTFRVSFDGRLVAEGKDKSHPRMGRIALVATGKPLELRLMRVRPLNREQHVNVPAPDKACFVCHDNFRKEKISRKHRAQDDEDEPEDDEHLKPAKQRPRRNGCAGCHGPSLAHRMDEDNVTAPDILYLRGEVKAACLRCHVTHKKESRRDDKQPGPLPANPVCTDCHGLHRASN